MLINHTILYNLARNYNINHAKFLINHVNYNHLEH